MYLWPYKINELLYVHNTYEKKQWSCKVKKQLLIVGQEHIPGVEPVISRVMQTK